MKKHAPRVSFPCPVLGCAYQKSRSFYRDDKLKVHLRMSHTDDALSQCPVQGCPIQPLSLDLLVAHASFHKQELHQTLPVLKVLKRNGRAGYFTHDKKVSKCPIGNLQSCGKWLSMDELSSHILSHPEEDRLKFRTDAREAGYDSMTGDSLCPICSKGFTDAAAFAMHIHLEHLHEPGSEGADHFSMFHHALLENMEYGADWNGVHLWKLDRWDFKNSFNCPSCQVPLESADRARRGEGSDNLTQHLQMHKEDITDVIQHRRQILKHYPDFAKHRIFDDLRVTSSAEVGSGVGSN